MALAKLIPLLFALMLLSACSDQRVAYEINGDPAHSLTLIRVTGMPWENTAQYDIVATRMPSCMRRHPMSKADLNAAIEVFSPGNGAWILKQGGRMYVTETRTCEGFAPLDKAPETGLGPLVGTFKMKDDTLIFVAAPKPVAPPEVSPAVSSVAPSSAEMVAPMNAAPVATPAASATPPAAPAAN